MDINFAKSYIIQLSRVIQRKDIPNNIILLISPPRSGSTLMLDLLRYHPDININKKSEIIEVLNVWGVNRYPQDLCNIDGIQKKIENKPGIFENIPNIGPDMPIHRNKKLMYNIEKMHPHYFYNPKIAICMLKKLRRRTKNLKIILLVRQPKQTIESFMGYQKRSKSWYSNYTEKNVVNLIYKSYVTIDKIHDNFESFVVSYDDLINHQEIILNKIYTFLFPKYDKSVLKNFAKESYKKAVELKRIRQNTPFISNSNNLTHSISDNIEFKTVITSIRSIYSKLLK